MIDNLLCSIKTQAIVQFASKLLNTIFNNRCGRWRRIYTTTRSRRRPPRSWSPGSTWTTASPRRTPRPPPPCPLPHPPPTLLTATSQTSPSRAPHPPRPQVLHDLIIPHDTSSPWPELPMPNAQPDSNIPFRLRSSRSLLT